MSNVNLLEKFSKFLDSLANPQEEVDELRECEQEDSDFTEGERYLIQTDTLWIFTGECAKISSSHVWFENVAWVQELGRVSDFMAADGGVAQYAEHFGTKGLRVAKRHIVFDVVVGNVIGQTLPAR